MLNFGFKGGASNIAYTNCYSPLAVSGTVYGYIDSVFGTITPDTVLDGTHIYQTSWDTADGSFIWAFGVAGDEALDNVKLIVVKYGSHQVELHWDATNEYYGGTDTAMADALALIGSGDVCLNTLVIPDLLIHYDFLEMEV